MLGRFRRWWLHPLSLTLAAVLAFVTWHQIGALAGVEGAVVRVLAPLQVRLVGGGSALAAWAGSFGRMKTLRDQHQRLTVQFQRLAVEHQQLKNKFEELTATQAQQEFAHNRQLAAVVARVVGKTIGAEAQVIVVDQGARAGIVAGLPVVVGEGILVGRVVEVGLEHAKVMLLTDGRSVTPASLSTNAKANGVVSGAFGVSLMMDLVPQDQALNVGDVVVTSGLEPDIPSGLLIGSITRVQTPPGNHFQVAYLQPLVPYQTLRVVSVFLTR